jgi:hypothetical protein
MGYVVGTKGYLTIAYLFRCTCCGDELLLELQENRTKAIKHARSEGWKCCYAGWYCRNYDCEEGARAKAKRMKEEHIPNYMLVLAE